MTLRINDIIPDLAVNTDLGEIRIHDFIGRSWTIIFSHPKDFTPVCTTEFGAVARMAGEFANRKTKLLGVSVDGVKEHVRWKADIEEYAGTKAAFPIVADRDFSMAQEFGMLPAGYDMPEKRTAAHAATVRTVFIVGPDKRVKLSMTYPMNVGRNFNEILRALDALQAAEKKNIATPADWQPGDDVIVPPSVSDDEARTKYGDFAAALPYLRTVPG